MSKSGGTSPALEAATETRTRRYPVHRTSIPQMELREGRYLVRFARTHAELDEVLKLRFEVFNLELGEGLNSSFRTGRDLDEFDETCHHLVAIDTEQNRIVGTYRMQTAEMAAAGAGLYIATEFDLSYFPYRVLSAGVELGRACVARSHRNTQALFLLWKGLAAYLAHHRKRYLFGCCSLTSQSEQEGARVLASLKRQGHLHPDLFLPPRPEFACRVDEPEAVPPEEVKLPRLFRTYLRYGAKVCSPPAIDRKFKTIDFLVVYDAAQMAPRMVKMFFAR
ncbi:MAG TPA: GNAT family N-acyltransferase [Blastocatellia bacterium]|nr:GNAT family N-acyltransferase [Blastocatellia bacterium]